MVVLQLSLPANILNFFENLQHVPIAAIKAKDHKDNDSVIKISYDVEVGVVIEISGSKSLVQLEEEKYTCSIHAEKAFEDEHDDVEYTVGDTDIATSKSEDNKSTSLSEKESREMDKDLKEIPSTNLEIEANTPRMRTRGYKRILSMTSQCPPSPKRSCKNVDTINVKNSSVKSQSPTINELEKTEMFLMANIEKLTKPIEQRIDSKCANLNESTPLHDNETSLNMNTQSNTEHSPRKKSERKMGLIMNRKLKKENGKSEHVYKQNCPNCSSIFHTFVDFVQHFKELHTDNSELTEDRVPVKEEINNIKGTFICRICDIHFENQEENNAHMFNKHNIEMDKVIGKRSFTSIICPYCKKSVNISKILIHMKNAHKKEEDLNDVLEHLKLFSHQKISELQVKKTKETNAESQTYRICQFCGKQVKTQCFRAHVNYVCPNNPGRRRKMTCTRCDKLFFNEAEWKIHKDTAHSKDFRPFICDKCGKSYANRAGLNKHKRRDHGIGMVEDHLHACPFCDKKFFEKAGLESHLNYRHTGGSKEFQCTTCGKSFADKYGLSRHIQKIHHHKYPHQCPNCGHGVEKKSYLKNHVCGRVRRLLPSSPNIKLEASAKATENNKKSRKVLDKSSTKDLEVHTVEIVNYPIQELEQITDDVLTAEDKMYENEAIFTSNTYVPKEGNMNQSIFNAYDEKGNPILITYSGAELIFDSDIDAQNVQIEEVVTMKNEDCNDNSGVEHRLSKGVSDVEIPLSQAEYLVGKHVSLGSEFAGKTVITEDVDLSEVQEITNMELSGINEKCQTQYYLATNFENAQTIDGTEVIIESSDSQNVLKLQTAQSALQDT